MVKIILILFFSIIIFIVFKCEFNGKVKVSKTVLLLFLSHVFTLHTKTMWLFYFPAVLTFSRHGYFFFRENCPLCLRLGDWCAYILFICKITRNHMKSRTAQTFELQNAAVHRQHTIQILSLVSKWAREHKAQNSKYSTQRHV